MDWNKYPYTDFHEFNQDWVIKTLKEVLSTLNNFVTLNTISFADPLQWDITSQYQINKIVIDANGNAYLSKKAVPEGVDIKNTEYWLEIFNFTEYVSKANKNLTVNFEYDTTVATADYSVGDWLIWEEVLYKVTAAITRGDDLVIDTNIEHFTIEQFLNDFVTNVNQTILQYKNDIDASELQYKNDIDASESAYRAQLAGDIATTTASLQAQLDAAIAGVTVDSEVINGRIGADGITYDTLGNAIRKQVERASQTVKLADNQALFDPLDSDAFDDFTTALSSDAWVNDYVYGAGYVEKIHVKKASATAGTIKLIFLTEDYKVIKILTVNTSAVDEEDIAVDVKIDQRFKLGVESTLLMYEALTSKYTSYYFSSSGLDVGDTITKTTYSNLDFSFYLKYSASDVVLAAATTYGKERDYYLPQNDDTEPEDYDGQSSLSEYWASKTTYPAGYIDRLYHKKQGDNTKVIIVDSVTSKIVFTGSSTTDYQDVKCYFPNPVWIFSYGSYYAVSSLISDPNFMTISNTYDVDHMAGSDFATSWSSGGYIFAIRVYYKDVILGNLQLKAENKPEMFICGDSITAGYPYYTGNPSYNNQDLRWGNQVGRRLGFDITFGAESGNGWLYSTGSANAYSITNDTNFADYDAVIYAWGTNDYGHDMVLGTPSDATSALTICGRVKYCIEKIYNDNAKIVMALVLPINRTDYGTKAANYAYGTANGAGYTLSDLCEALKTICENYGIICIDSRTSAFSRMNIDAYLGDRLHPNMDGYKILGSFITGQFSAMHTPYYLNALTE